jgi:putative transposase
VARRTSAGGTRDRLPKKLAALLDHPVRDASIARLGAALAVLHEARFHDAAPAQVHATLLDEGTFVCSVRSMYRLLEAADEVRERRAQRTHPPCAVPRLVARAPNHV